MKLLKCATVSSKLDVTTEDKWQKYTTEIERCTTNKN